MIYLDGVLYNAINGVKKAVTSANEAIAAARSALSAEHSSILSGVNAVGASDVVKNGVVKSVQRGVLLVTANISDSDVKTVTIKTVDVNKSIVFVHALIFHNDMSTDGKYWITDYVLDSSKIDISITYAKKGVPLIWQVIEFY